MPTGILADMPGRITSATFVGRKDQLEGLLEVFDATLTGPAVVLLGGEAGVGKTRLVTEFARRRAGTRVLVGACLELGQAVMPFAPLAGVLRSVQKYPDAPPTWELLRNAALCARYSGDIRAGALPLLRRAIAVLGVETTSSRWEVCGPSSARAIGWPASATRR